MCLFSNNMFLILFKINNRIRILSHCLDIWLGKVCGLAKEGVVFAQKSVCGYFVLGMTGHAWLSSVQGEVVLRCSSPQIRQTGKNANGEKCFSPNLCFPLLLLHGTILSTQQTISLVKLVEFSVLSSLQWTGSTPGRCWAHIKRLPAGLRSSLGRQTRVAWRVLVSWQ